MYSDTVNAASAASMLGVKERTLADYVKKGLLKPVPGNSPFERLNFRTEDLLTFLELRNQKPNWQTVVTASKQASANVRRLERLVEQLMLVIGADVPLADLEPEAIVANHLKAQDASDLPVQSSEVFKWARFMVAIGEEYLELITVYTGDPEPWLTYLNLAANIQKSRISVLHKDDAESRAAYQYLDMARRRLRETAFFHVRAAHGRRYAYELFPEVKDGAHAELVTLSSVMFP